MGKEALAVKRKILFWEDEFQGFLPIEERDFISIILNNHTYYPRGEKLENNDSLQQIIPYVWIINPKTKSVFLYKRTLNGKDNKAYKEKRYLNKYSGGVGGHIDSDTEKSVSNPIIAAMIRELQEEIVMKKHPKPKIIGYINDDSDSLGRVHFGIVAIAETRENIQARSSEGLSSGKFYSIKEIEEIFCNQENEVENWTRISWPFIKDYLSKL